VETIQLLYNNNLHFFKPNRISRTYCVFGFTAVCHIVEIVYPIIRLIRVQL
jgi:hypothetical protein